MSKGNGSGGGNPEVEWLGRALGVLGIVVVLVMAALNTAGVTPKDIVVWSKALPQHVADAAAWVGDKVSGTRCALHPCDEKKAAAADGPPTAAVGPYKVAKVTDGDTIHVVIGAKNTTVRVLGIDTPETHDPRKVVQCYGPEAATRGHQLLDGKSVYLEYDATQHATDRYGRVLAYVWVDGSLYEQTMLEEGFAHEYTYAKAYARQKPFRAAQAAAKAAQAGFWAATTCNGNTTQPEPARSTP